MAPADPRTVTRLGLVLLCALSAGCGGGGGPSDRDRIATAVKLASSSRHIKDVCEVAVTTRFVRDVWGSLAACRRVNTTDPERDVFGKVSVSRTRIAADRATTAVKMSTAGVTIADGRLALVKDGGDWKVDRFGVDFLRSYLTGLGRLPHSPKGAEPCLRRVLRGASRSRVREIGNAVIGGGSINATTDLAPCLIGSPDAIGRDIVKDAITQRLRKAGGYTPARQACVVRRLQRTVSDDEFAALAGGRLSVRALPASVGRRIRRAIAEC